MTFIITEGRGWTPRQLSRFIEICWNESSTYYTLAGSWTDPKNPAGVFGVKHAGINETEAQRNWTNIQRRAVGPYLINFFYGGSGSPQIIEEVSPHAGPPLLRGVVGWELLKSGFIHAPKLGISSGASVPVESLNQFKQLVLRNLGRLTGTITQEDENALLRSRNAGQYAPLIDSLKEVEGMRWAANLAVISPGTVEIIVGSYLYLYRSVDGTTLVSESAHLDAGDRFLINKGYHTWESLKRGEGVLGKQTEERMPESPQRRRRL